MNKYTPGPWPLIKKMDGFTAVGAKTLIARVYSEAFQDIENEEANARLIQAAPDLLEAIKEVLPIGWGIDDTMDHIPGLKKARLAIAKAEGRA